MILTQQDVNTANEDHLKKLQFTHENMNIKILEFQNAVRFGNWDQARAAQQDFLNFAEAHMDAFAEIYLKSVRAK